MTHYKSFLFAGVATVLFSCQEKQADSPNENLISQAENSLDSWHQAAANADFDTYFGLMTNDAVFIGTEATENWQAEDFKAYSKPHFDKGKAWSFTSIERNMYLDENKKLIWFDELLDTQMGICRGSGILQLQGTVWKVKHYVLSMTIPNDLTKDIVSHKEEWDSLYIQKIKQVNL